MSDCHNTPRHLLSEQWMLWEWTGGLGSAGVMKFLVDWNRAQWSGVNCRVQHLWPPELRASAGCTADHSEWGQVPTLLNEFSLTIFLLSAIVKLSMHAYSFHISTLEVMGYRQPLFFIYLHSFSLYPSSDTCFHLFLFVITQDYNNSALSWIRDYLVYGGV